MEEKKKKCSNCHEESDNLHEVGASELCTQCFKTLQDGGEIETCCDCNDIKWSEDTRYISGHGTVCDSCYGDGDYFFCNHCEEYYHNDHRGGESDIGNEYCERCLDDNPDLLDNDGIEDEQVHMRTPDLSNTEHQSDDAGDVITSDRRFGVELEVYNENDDENKKGLLALERSYGIEHDGSVQGRNAVEIVSPILRGKLGEKSIKDVLKTLKKHKFQVNLSCGFHVHLEAKSFVGTNEKIIIHKSELADEEKKIEKSKRYIRRYVIMNHEALKVAHLRTSPSGIQELVRQVDNFIQNEDSNNGFYELPDFGGEQRTLFVSDTSRNNMYGVPSSVLKIWAFTGEREDKLEAEYEDDLIQYRKSLKAHDLSKILSKPERKEYFARDSRDTDFVLLDVAGGGSFNALKNVLLFYTSFNDVFMAMLPEDRRNGNIYCRKLVDTFSPLEINKLQSQEELEKYWYKINDRHIEAIRGERGRTVDESKAQKYNWSRYHGVNFHCLFKQGTIEVRWHGGTLDEKSILYWIALHQRIIDTIAKNISSEQIIKAGNAFLLKDKINLFLDVLGIEKGTPLSKYVLQRVEHCTGEKIK